MPEAAEGEFDLRTLDDAELTEQVHDDLYNGLKAEVEEATRIFLERGWSPDRIATLLKLSEFQLIQSRNTSTPTSSFLVSERSLMIVSSTNSASPPFCL